MQNKNYKISLKQVAKYLFKCCKSTKFLKITNKVLFTFPLVKILFVPNTKLHKNQIYHKQRSFIQLKKNHKNNEYKNR